MEDVKTQLTKLEELEGKTIISTKKTYYDNYLALYFDDGSYCIFTSEPDYCGESTIHIEDKDYEKLKIQDKYELGFITKETYEVELAEREASYKHAREERERKEYERLKNVYGN